RELTHRIVLPRVEHLEGEADPLVRPGGLRCERQIETVLSRVWNPGDELHATPRAFAWTGRPDVTVHRTDVGEVNGRIRRRGRLAFGPYGIGCARRGFGAPAAPTGTHHQQDREHRCAAHRDIVLRDERIVRQ